jgi:hypothetical protein
VTSLVLNGEGSFTPFLQAIWILILYYQCTAKAGGKYLQRNPPFKPSWKIEFKYAKLKIDGGRNGEWHR